MNINKKTDLNEKDLVDLKICDGRITEKVTTEKDVIKWLKSDKDEK